MQKLKLDSVTHPEINYYTYSNSYNCYQTLHVDNSTISEVPLLLFSKSTQILNVKPLNKVQAVIFPPRHCPEPPECQITYWKGRIIPWDLHWQQYDIAWCHMAARKPFPPKPGSQRFIRLCFISHHNIVFFCISFSSIHRNFFFVSHGHVPA